MLVGFDIGGTNARGLLIDPSNGEVIDSARGSSAGEGRELVATIIGIIDDLQTRNDVLVKAVGLGVAGLATSAGTIRYSPNLPDLIEFPIGPELEAALGIPVVVDNDATAAAWAEAELGAGRGASDFIFVALGTGIGTGFVAGGQLIHGAHGFAGESGHMVIDMFGPTHRTGQSGPWEYFASGSALGRMAREAARSGDFAMGLELAADVEAITGHQIAEALSVRDADAERIFDRFCREVARGLANLVLIFDPERVIIGGGLIEIGTPLCDGVRGWLDQLLLGSRHRPEVEVVLAQLGSKAGAVGAALLAAEIAKP